MRNEIIQISAKNLAALGLADCCKRCFWLKLKVKFSVPFQIFPGIFSSIDAYTKQVIRCYFQRHKRVPPWLKQLGSFSRLCAAPHWSDFNVIDTETHVKLTGMPDEVLERRDKSFFVIDYKTAKFTDTQDQLIPMYSVQLNAYAYIAERCVSSQFAPVTGLWLVFFEPQTELTTETVEPMLIPSGFHMPFSARPFEIDLEPEKTIRPLLQEVRRLANLDSPPEGRHWCKDCKTLEALLRLSTAEVFDSHPALTQ